MQREAAATRLACASLYEFVKRAWHVIEPSTPFVGGWAIEAMCKHLEAVTDGRITRLLITIPPGTSKSTIVNVLWPAWEWTKRPGIKIVATSYSRKNVIRDNNRMRQLVESDWYKAAWGHLVVPTDKWGEELFVNTATGQRDGRPFASITGARGDRVVIDDPHSTETAESDAVRARTIRTFREQLTDRLNDVTRSAIVIVMQRLHAGDVAGVIKQLHMGYVHLNLPMEFESYREEGGVRADARCRTYVDGKLFFEDPRKQDGELLFPDRFPRAAVEGLKRDKGSYAYAGQYQQRPTAREGGMFKRAWFAGKIIPRQKLPAMRLRARSWDFASKREEPGTDPDYTASVRMAAFEADYYIEHAERFRETPGFVQRNVVSRRETDPEGTKTTIPLDPGQAGVAQVESYTAAMAGYQLTIMPTSGRGRKEERAEPLAIQAEYGKVWFVNSGPIEDGVDPWIELLIDELCSFPMGSHDDMVDACSDAFATIAGKAQKPFEIITTGPRVATQATARDMAARFGDKLGRDSEEAPDVVSLPGIFGRRF